jgi:predicted MFS family arabinose efflux permease
MTDASARTPPMLAVRIFLAFAFAYFISALLRAVTATLAPAFSTELGLGAADLGLLAGAFFLGFALLQLPLGSAIDRIGPRRVQLGLMTLAVVGCAAMSLAHGLGELIAARFLVGMGVAACLMAPLTCYRWRFSPATQLRANSWMLMTGSLGMLASTLPVQWLLPTLGWRGVFQATAVLLVGAIAVIAWFVPPDEHPPVPPRLARGHGSYWDIMRHPVFVRSAPVGFFVYGGMIAVQTLWAGPWLTRVAGWSATEAAGGLFGINFAMLCAFLAWGLVMPRLIARGVTVHALTLRGLVLPLVLTAWIVSSPAPAGAMTWAIWCVSCTVVSLSQPAVGQAFPPALAGRALSAFNLVIFAGVFVLQWGIGLLIDAFEAAGTSAPVAFRAALAVFGVCAGAAYIWYVWASRRMAPESPVDN